MALSELQKTLVTKTHLYQKIANRTSKFNHDMADLAEFVEWLNMMTPEDATELNIPAEMQINIDQLRTFFGEVVSLYNNNSVTPTNDPQTVINKLRGF